MAEGKYDAAETPFLDALLGGLPIDRIAFFIGALTEHGQMKRAVAFRTKTNRISADD